MNTVEQRAAETLLDKGVPILLRAPLLLRLFGKKRIRVVLGNPFGGTLLHINRYFLSMGLSVQEMAAMEFNGLLTAQVKHHKTVYRLVACALLNSRWLRGLLTKPLAWLLADMLLYKAACRLVEILVVQGGIEDFTNIIGLGARLNMLIPKPSQTNSHTS